MPSVGAMACPRPGTNLAKRVHSRGDGLSSPWDWGACPRPGTLQHENCNSKHTKKTTAWKEEAFTPTLSHIAHTDRIIACHHTPGSQLRLDTYTHQHNREDSTEWYGYISFCPAMGSHR